LGLDKGLKSYLEDDSNIQISGTKNMFPPDGIFFTYLFTGALWSGTTYLIHVFHIRLLGESWVKSRAAETERKKKKGIIKE